MYGELTDKETVSRLEYSLENQQQDQFEVLLYKKNSKFMITSCCITELCYPKSRLTYCWSKLKCCKKYVFFILFVLYCSFIIVENNTHSTFEAKIFEMTV